MLRVEQHGDVTRFEMSSVVSRLVGYTASAFLVRGTLIDCGFHGARREVDTILARERPRGVVITHYHEVHAGNVERVASLGIPIGASPETIAKVRAPKPIRLYRRLTWRSAPPLRSAVTPFESDRLKLLAAPGHCSDHHVVWDSEDGTLFGGDLYLGVKVRIAHPGEDPRILSATLRGKSRLDRRNDRRNRAPDRVRRVRFGDCATAVWRRVGARILLGWRLLAHELRPGGPERDKPVRLAMKRFVRGLTP